MEKVVTEKELLRRIKVLNKSEKIKRLITEIKEELLDMGAYLVESRVKPEESALESFKNNKVKATVSKDLYRTIGMTNPDTVKSFENVDTVVDLLALRVITHNANDIYKIKDFLNQKYNSFLIIDLINEPLIGFEYRAIHMYFKLKLDNINFEVPMEIQVKTYEMHHAWAGLHDTIYKNPNINLRDGCTLLPILFKIFEFNVRILKKMFNEEDIQFDYSGIDSIIDYNKPIFEKYNSTIEKSCYLLAKSIYYDKNKNSKLTDKDLYNKFTELRDNYDNSKEFDSKLHLCGNASVEYATYCIATNSF